MKIYIFSLEKSVQCQQRLTFHLPSITKHCPSITSQTLMKHFTVSSLPLQVLTASANLVAHSLQLEGADSSSASSCFIFEAELCSFCTFIRIGCRQCCSHSSAASPRTPLMHPWFPFFPHLSLGKSSIKKRIFYGQADRMG